jgi:pilus assembly protein Flp/PilA
MSTALMIRFQNAVAAAKDERGAAMAEYGLLLALVALAAIAILVLFGEQLVDVFTEATDTLENRGAPAPPAP